MGGLSGRRWAVVAAASGTVLIGGGAALFLRSAAGILIFEASRRH